MTNQDQMPEPGPVSDADTENWVDRHAPAAWRPFLRLSRVDRPIGTWLLFIPCLWGLGLAVLAEPPLWRGQAWMQAVWIVIGCGLGSVLMRGAGCSWNDVTDRDIDAQVARTRSRPLPSGQVSFAHALIWIGVQTALAAIILFTFPIPAIMLGLVALIPVMIYPFAKRFTWWPQVFLGVAFNWGVLLAFAAWSGTLSLAALLAYLAGLTWTLFYDTIYAHQDREDDALIGVKSTARLFGETSGAWLAGFAALSVVLLALAVLQAAPPSARPIALIGVVAFGGHLAWQWRRLDIHDTDLCLRLFRSNRDAGLLPLPFLAMAAVM